MFGFRGWHDGDLAAVDSDVLEVLIQSAVMYEAEKRKAASS